MRRPCWQILALDLDVLGLHGAFYNAILMQASSLHQAHAFLMRFQEGQAIFFLQEDVDGKKLECASSLCDEDGSVSDTDF